MNVRTGSVICLTVAVTKMQVPHQRHHSCLRLQSPCLYFYVAPPSLGSLLSLSFHCMEQSADALYKSKLICQPVESCLPSPLCSDGIISPPSCFFGPLITDCNVSTDMSRISQRGDSYSNAAMGVRLPGACATRISASNAVSQRCHPRCGLPSCIITVRHCVRRAACPLHILQH